MTVLEEGSLEELRATQQLLQRCHDRVETIGFNIMSYRGARDVLSDVEADGSGPACYIGTVRLEAGVDGYAGRGVDPGSGDGPELRIALRILDELAWNDSDRPDDCGTPSNSSAGRVVEEFGFAHPSGGTALRFFRRALTQVYERIKSLEESA